MRRVMSPRRLPYVAVCVLALCGAVVPLRAEALFAHQTLSELRTSSALIVTGHVSAATPGAGHDMPGKDILTLVIDRVLVGDLAGDAVPLAVPARTGPVSSTDIFYAEGASGLWFLRAKTTAEGRVYLADTPQRFVPAAEAAEVIRALKAMPD
jgi:hypothetical protein